MQQYEKLSALSRRAHLLDGISGLLGWDQETYMPNDAAPIRAMQREILAELAHTIKTGAEFEKLLQELENNAHQLDDEKKAALRAYKRDFLRLKKLPTSFVQEFAKITSEAIFVWDKAKKENDFAHFQPHLEKIVSLLRKKADFLGYQEHPYDALIDEYEPGITTKEVGALFSQLSAAIPSLLVELIDLQEGKNEPKKLPELTSVEQLQLSKKVLELIGFDFQRGRLDLSSHPFSSAYHPFDSRITTRLEVHGFVNQVLTTLHEAGHSFYEMGLPPDKHGTPLAEAISLGIHECESRTWETRIGRTLPFWKFLLPLIQKLFPGRFDTLNVEELFYDISRVQPSLIRTDSDEVTYPLHVILRFEIEKELLEGSVQVKDLPARWNEKMHTLLGIRPHSDREGCLQDIHWSMGAFGYFPTYSLGNLYAASLFEVFEKEHPDWAERIQKGDFSFLKAWHQAKVFSHGRRYTSKELIEKLTQKPISAQSYINYLTNKYRNILK